jgi:hypothetical protein
MQNKYISQASQLESLDELIKYLLQNNDKDRDLITMDEMLQAAEKVYLENKEKFQNEQNSTAENINAHLKDAEREYELVNKKIGIFIVERNLKTLENLNACDDFATFFAHQFIKKMEIDPLSCTKDDIFPKIQEMYNEIEKVYSSRKNIDIKSTEIYLNNISSALDGAMEAKNNFIEKYINSVDLTKDLSAAIAEIRLTNLGSALKRKAIETLISKTVAAEITKARELEEQINEVSKGAEGSIRETLEKIQEVVTNLEKIQEVVTEQEATKVLDKVAEVVKLQKEEVVKLQPKVVEFVAVQEEEARKAQIAKEVAAKEEARKAQLLKGLNEVQQENRQENTNFWRCGLDWMRNILGSLWKLLQSAQKKVVEMFRR